MDPFCQPNAFFSCRCVEAAVHKQVTWHVVQNQRAGQWCDKSRLPGFPLSAAMRRAYNMRRQSTGTTRVIDSIRHWKGRP
jgi:hypothetical protein